MFIGKVMIISFENEEEDVLKQIVNLLVNQRFEVIEQESGFDISSSKLKFLPREHRIEVDSKNLVLGRKQFTLLLLLAKNPNKIFTKEEIYAYVWNDVIPINVEETIRYHVSVIRKKLSKLCGDNFIQTVWGIGYRFCENAEEH